MVKFPEVNARVLPEFPETSLQQRWRAKQTEALTARRTWKSAQMAVTSICIPFKTYLVKEFGEDYIGNMMLQFQNTQLGVPTSMNTAIAVVMGPSMPIKPQLPDEPSPEEQTAHSKAMDSYNALVEVAKTYVGMNRPDTETASRIVTLVVKMRQYHTTVYQAETEAQKLAVESLVKGETPSASLLRSVTQTNTKYNYETGEFVPSPLNFSKYGVNSDDPRQWNGDQLMLDILTPLFWRSGPSIPSNVTMSIDIEKMLVADWAMSEYGILNLAFSGRTENGGLTPKTYRLFPNASLLITDSRVGNFGNNTELVLVTDKSFHPGWFAASESNGFRNIGKIVLFYAKAYSKTSDPLTFWSTHAKYRVVSRVMGTRGTFGEITAVDAEIGAPSDRASAIFIFPKGTPSGTAIISLKQYFPYLMDVESGNNPKIDKYIASKIEDQKIATAGANFSKLPPSAQTGYRFVAVTETVMAYPGDVMHPEPGPNGYKILLSPNSRHTFDTYFREPARNAGGVNLNYIRNRFANQVIKSDTAPTRSIRGWHRNAVRSKQGMRFNSLTIEGSPFHFIKQTNYKRYNPEKNAWISSRYETQTPLETPFSWSSATKSMPKETRQIIYGLPSPHPHSRIISKLKIVLVPAHIDTAIREVYAELKKLKGKMVKVNQNRDFTGLKWVPKQVVSPDWLAYSNAMIALTSGHWANEGSWIRDGSNPLRFDYIVNTMFSTMGIPVDGTPTYISKHQESGTGALSATDQEWELEQVMAVLSKHGLTDLSGIKTVYEDTINDVDDIAGVIKTFRKAFPGIQELVVPDVADITELGPRQRPFNANVTGFGKGFIVKVPGYQIGQYASHIVRRVPINVKGTSGKQHTFGGQKAGLNELTLTTNTEHMEVDMSGSVTPILAGTALGAAALGAYALIRGITSR